MEPTTEQPPQVQSGDSYRCRSCRKVLFTKFVHHNAECSSYFIDKPEWLTEQNSQQNDARLNCPKCKCKIGEVVFSGKKCSCMQWITPGIQIHANKVDRIRQM